MTDIESKQASETSSRTATLTMGAGDDNEPEFDKPPDGGLQAWLQVLGVHLIIFNTWGYVNAFGVFQSYYVETLDVSPSVISWVGSIQIFLIFFLGTFTGRALDAGYFRYLSLAGSVLIVVGILSASFATTYWQLLLSQGLCGGVGAGMVFCPSLALCSTYFHKNKSWALGVGTAGSGTGGMIFPLVVKTLLPKIGFAWTMRSVGLITLVCLAVANLIMKPRLKPRKAGSLVEWAAFKERPYTLFAAAMFMNFLGLYFAFFYISAFARTRIGLSKDSAFSVVVILNSAGLPGRLVPSYLAQRTGPLNLMIPTCFISGILMMTWTRVNTHAGIIIWATFYGFWAAGIQSLFPAILSSLTSDPSKAGTRMGMVFSIVSFATLTGSPIGGALIEMQGGDYWAAQLFAGLALMLGGSLLTASKVAKTGWAWRALV